MAHQPPFSHITIIGVGLIGGSLGLAIRKQFPGITVTGVDKPAVLRQALRRRAIHAGVSSLSGAVSGADLVILATPVGTIRTLLPRVARVIRRETLVTDVGSVKKPIVGLAKRLFPHGNFIGGHPMAGVELSGIEAAHPLLFENAIYVLTPYAKTKRALLNKLVRLLRGIGARLLRMDASEHDAVAAAVSHLPQLVAVAVMNLAGRGHPVAKRYLRLAAGGFRDLTRVASSSFDLWAQILPENRGEIVRALRLLERQLAAYRRELTRRNTKALAREFRSSRRLRREIPKDMKGFLHRLATLEVFVPDKPGMLARLTTALAKRGINIKDLELMKVREGTGGTFRLSFESGEERQKARKLLSQRGFESGR